MGVLAATGALADRPGDLVGAFSQSSPNKLSVFQDRRIVQTVQLTADGGADVRRVVTLHNAMPAGAKGDPDPVGRVLRAACPPAGGPSRAAERPGPAPEQHGIRPPWSRPTRTGPFPDGQGGQVMWQGHEIPAGAEVTVEIDYSLPPGTFAPGSYEVSADPQALTIPAQLEIVVTPAPGEPIPSGDGWTQTGGSATWTRHPRPSTAPGGELMRIGLLGTRGVPAQYGGFETAVEEIGRRLAERGHEVVVYCRNPGQVRTEYLGMRLVNLPAVRLRAAETPVTHDGVRRSCPGARPPGHGLRVQRRQRAVRATAAHRPDSRGRPRRRLGVATSQVGAPRLGVLPVGRRLAAPAGPTPSSQMPRGSPTTCASAHGIPPGASPTAHRSCPQVPSVWRSWACLPRELPPGRRAVRAGEPRARDRDRLRRVRERDATRRRRRCPLRPGVSLSGGCGSCGSTPGFACWAASGTTTSWTRSMPTPRHTCMATASGARIPPCSGRWAPERQSPPSTSCSTVRSPGRPVCSSQTPAGVCPRMRGSRVRSAGHRGPRPGRAVRRCLALQVG